MKFASRLYTDLIYKSLSKFANWDPSRRIKAGDYGNFDYDTGLFEKEGNIYEDKVVEDIETKYPLIEDVIVDYESVHSSDAKECNFDAGLLANIAGTENAALQLQFNFSDKRGALLIMHHSRMQRVPDKFLDISTTVNCLKRKLLVTGVVTCPGYIKYMSSKQNETLAIALTANAPVEAIPGLSAGGTASFKWKTSNVSGNLQASYRDGEKYTPLFYAKSIRGPSWPYARRRETPEPEDPNDFDQWAPATIPWDTLTDDGEEMRNFYPVYTDSEASDSDDNDDVKMDED